MLLIPCCMSAQNADTPTPENLTRTAYHEAGHAVLQHALALGCKGVTIELEGLSTDFSETDDDVAALRSMAEDAFSIRHAETCYAGALATRRWNPLRDDWQDGAVSDYRTARAWINNATLGDEQSSIHLEAYTQRRAEILVEHHWPEIDALAQWLLESGTLTGDDVRRLVKRLSGHMMGV